MLLLEMTELQEPSIIYEDTQGYIHLAKNRQVNICTNHIDIRHHFIQDMVEYKDNDIYYIQSENDPVDIITKNTLEADFAKAYENNHGGRTLGACGY